jgi:hypothetical protein
MIEILFRDWLNRRVRLAVPGDDERLSALASPRQVRAEAVLQFGDTDKTHECL